MADMSWTDGGKSSKAQFFYGNRKGRRQVGMCGRYEARTTLYAARLEKTWRRLFKMKNGRDASGEEFWAALRTGQIAEDVRIWEKTDLTGKMEKPKKPLIHRSSTGERMTKVLDRYVKDEKARAEAKIQRELQEQADFEAKMAEDNRIIAIRKSSEVPHQMLERLSKGMIPRDAVALAFGITNERIAELLQAWGYTS